MLPNAFVYEQIARQDKMGDFLKDYGAHLLGFVALAQVWVIALWKKYLRKSTVEIHPAGTIEIGFGNFGPSISLLGTLRVRSRDVFVDEMRVQVTRMKDKAEKTLYWKAFRSNTISLTMNISESVEIARSFSVTTDIPREYNVFLASTDFASNYLAKIPHLRNAWRTFVTNTVQQNDPNLLSAALQDPNISGQFFEKFMSQNLAAELYELLNNDFFWHASEYRIDLTISCTNPTPDVATSWMLTLNEQDEKDLRLNIVSLIRELVYLPPWYSVANKNYPR